MRVALVDDEQLAIEGLEILLNRIGGIEVRGSYTNPEIAIREIGKLEVDAVFLDMEMGAFHGLQIADELKAKHPKLEIIFVTAHAQFAVGAFEVKAFDYLLKPINQARLEKAVHQLQEKLGICTAVKTSIEPDKKYLSARTMGSFHLTDSEDNKVKWRTRKVKELFIYLWSHSPNPVHPARILEDLWTDHLEDRAKTLMHTSLYQLRKTIRDTGFENPVTLINEQYIFDMDIKSDLDELEQMMATANGTHADIEMMIDLYKGNYLEEENYDWAIIKQRDIKGAFLAHIGNYVKTEMADDNPKHLVGTCLEKMIELDPYNERFVYLLVDYYGKTKNLQKMAAVVEKFKKIWVEELGIDIPDDIYKIYNAHMIET